MQSKVENLAGADLIRAWALSYEATLGSSVRSRGIFLEVRARLPSAARKSLAIKSRELTFRMPASEHAEFTRFTAVISDALEGIESLPVIPRELEDILAIKSTERHRWLKDGRLPSAGTRTVKLRGRAKKITFHVFDPRVVEDILDRDLIDRWREDDAERTAENRRRAVWKVRLSRSQKAGVSSVLADGEDDEDRFKLRGWAEFERESLLR